MVQAQLNWWIFFNIVVFYERYSNFFLWGRSVFFKWNLSVEIVQNTQLKKTALSNLAKFTELFVKLLGYTLVNLKNMMAFEEISRFQ